MKIMSRAISPLRRDERETLQIALATMTKYGLALERISRHPTADTWECKPLAEIAREALGLTPSPKETEP